MTSFDIFILSMIALSALFAWMRGLGREVLTLVAIALGFLAIQIFGGPVSGLFGDGLIGPIIGLGLVFFVAFVIASVGFEVGMSSLFGRDPGLWDKVAGAVFGLLRGWILVGLAYVALTYYAEEDNMPPAVDGAALKGVATSAAAVLDRAGLKKQAGPPAAGDQGDEEGQPDGEGAGPDLGAAPATPQ